MLQPGVGEHYRLEGAALCRRTVPFLNQLSNFPIHFFLPRHSVSNSPVIIYRFKIPSLRSGIEPILALQHSILEFGPYLIWITGLKLLSLDLGLCLSFGGICTVLILNDSFCRRSSGSDFKKSTTALHLKSAFSLHLGEECHSFSILNHENSIL